MFAEQRGDRADGSVGALEQRMTVLGVADGGLKHLGKRHGAVVAQQHHPSFERAGDASGKQAGAGYEIEPFAAVMSDRGTRWGYALAANHFRFGALYVVEDDRHIAAWPVEVRLHHLQRERGRHRSIERIAAALQYAHAHGGRDPVGGGDHAERTFDFRPSGEGVRINVGHKVSLVGL